MNKRGTGVWRARTSIVCWICVLPALTGCFLKPDFTRPTVLTEAGYRDGAAVQDTAVNMPWWELYGDEQLKSLIATALRENRDLGIAMARVDESRAILGVARADQLPRLDGIGGASRTGVSQSLLAGLPGMSPRNDFSLLGNLSFEVDLWGRYASATEAQRAQLAASENALKGATLTLVAQTASVYLQILDFDRQVAISERTLAGRQKSTKLIAERFKQGYTGKIDLNQAQIQEQQAAVALVALKRARRISENALSVLLGHTPHSIQVAKADTNPLAIETIPTGVPAELLERRPDVRAAEELARAALMRVGVARAAQFPSLSLAGVLGLNSRESSELFTSDGRTWSAAGNLLGPIIDFGKSWSGVDAAQAAAKQALLAYEQTVLQAVREVEDARIAVLTFAEEQRIRQEQVAAAQSADMLSQRRYTDGVTSYLEVLNSQESLFSSELAYSNSQQRYLTAIVQLYKALGGGWERPEAAKS